MNQNVIALEARLRHCRNVTTLGVRPNFCDYSEHEADLIREAEKIYFPTAFYAELFDSTGKKIFPSVHNYTCAQDKIKQTALFKLLKIPHPKTRVFYGSRQKKKILTHFHFPFVAKQARGSAMGRGVFLIESARDLEVYLENNTPAYIQDYLPIDRDIRVVIIGKKVVHAYWRIAAQGEFRSNVARGATISLDPVPEKAVELARHTAVSCGWNDVGLDICMSGGSYYLIEGNMKYGKEGFRTAGIDFYRLMENMIENGEI